MPPKILRIVIIIVVFCLGVLTAYVSWCGIICIGNFHISISAWWKSWLQNFSTGMFGTLATYILIQLIVEGREKKVETEKAELVQMEKERKELKLKQVSFVEQLKKPLDLPVRQNLVDEMRSLDLLQEVNFWQANLDGINLKFSNLTNAYMIGASLIEADLEYTDLTGADLQFADLMRAKIQSAKLVATNLTNANLSGASMDNCQFSHETFMPDGTRWNEMTRLERFTNPGHPNFWRPPTSYPNL